MQPNIQKDKAMDYDRYIYLQRNADKLLVDFILKDKDKITPEDTIIIPEIIKAFSVDEWIRIIPKTKTDILSIDKHSYVSQNTKKRYEETAGNITEIKLLAFDILKEIRGFHGKTSLTNREEDKLLRAINPDYNKERIEQQHNYIINNIREERKDIGASIDDQVETAIALGENKHNRVVTAIDKLNQSLSTDKIVEILGQTSPRDRILNTASTIEQAKNTLARVGLTVGDVARAEERNSNSSKYK